MNPRISPSGCRTLHTESFTGTIPTVAWRIIGIRQRPPAQVRGRNQGNARSGKKFLKVLPHRYYEENNSMCSSSKVSGLQPRDGGNGKRLPYVDNWATCDMFGAEGFPETFGRNAAQNCAWLGSKGAVYGPLRGRDADEELPDPRRMQRYFLCADGCAWHGDGARKTERDATSHIHGARMSPSNEAARIMLASMTKQSGHPNCGICLFTG